MTKAFRYNNCFLIEGRKGMVVNNKNLCTYCFEEVSDDAASCQFCSNSADSQGEATSNLPVGTILLGKFIIGKVLGKGGFGVTYLAYDLRRECKVAIKEYMPDTLSYRTPGKTLVSTYLGEKEDSFKLGSEKFYEEAKTISKFNGHPNIINVHEFFYENNTAYFVMEYIDGMDLKTYIIQKGGKISQDEGINLLIPIMDALIVVHSIGILHRDISPDNIYITKAGDVKLLDFGAARQVVGEKSKSLSVILKPGFAPFEQYQTRGKQGPWTDVYALAATMYYCLAGQIPEAAMDRMEVDNIKLLSGINVNVSENVEQILQKALSIKGIDRYQTMAEFKQAFINARFSIYQNNKTPVVKLEENINKPALKYRKNIISIAIAAAILIITCINFTIWQITKNDSTEVSRNGNATPNFSPVKSNDYVTPKLAEVTSDSTQSNNSITSATSTETDVQLENQLTSVSNVDYVYATSNFSVKSKYTGKWKDNKPNGLGKLTIYEDYSKHWIYGDKLTGNFINGVLIGEGELTRTNGDIYKGNFDGDSEGQGCYISKDYTYDGQWKNGQHDGQGTVTFPNGDKYEGQFKNSVFEGQGTYYYSNGSKYAGEWINGQQNGQGMLKDSNGLYIGKWENGRQNGQGTIVWSNLSKYVGEWKNGTMDGQGTLFDAEDNITKQGKWVNNEFVGS